MWRSFRGASARHATLHHAGGSSEPPTAPAAPARGDAPNIPRCSALDVGNCWRGLLSEMFGKAWPSLAHLSQSNISNLPNLLNLLNLQQSRQFDKILLVARLVPVRLSSCEALWSIVKLCGAVDPQATHGHVSVHAVQDVHAILEELVQRCSL